MGWRYKPSKGHPWGRMLCPEASTEGCIMVVSSTPRSPESHAKSLRRLLKLCTCAEDEGDAEDENE